MGQCRFVAGARWWAGGQHGLTLGGRRWTRQAPTLTDFLKVRWAMSHKRTSGADEGGRADRAQEIGLFRYALIRPVADPALTTRQRGPLVRELAELDHLGPFGDRVRVSRVTLDRWIRAWRAGGFDALVPSPRHVEPRTEASVLELAAALKREVPARTAAQVAVILGEHAGCAPSARTLQRHFARLELGTRPDGTPPKAFGRFEAAAPNDRWTGDALHGPVVAGRKTYLFAFIDDHSRALRVTGGGTVRTRSGSRPRYAMALPAAGSHEWPTWITARP
jgi:putative transposase